MDLAVEVRVMIVTPVAKHPIARRNSEESKPIS